MPEPTPRGAVPDSPYVIPRDPVIRGVDQALRHAEVHSGTVPLLGLMRDSVRATPSRLSSLARQGQILFGVVVHAIPFAHWYKVQCGPAGWLPACKLMDAGGVPLGPKDATLLPPNTGVLVFVPAGLSHGYILGPVPAPVTNGNVVCPDWLVQGGGSGLRREAAHQFPITATFRQGGVTDWSNGRPADGTSMEWARVMNTGVAVLLDDFQAYLRVNEMCGLFLNWWDSHCRLAGVQLDVESAVHGEYARDDEGEARLFRGVAAYPWEALGLYAPALDFTAENEDKAVQYTLHQGAVDLAAQDTQPIYRYQEFGGYLGQGHYRAVIRPAATAGVRRHSDRTPDEGLFRESIALTGAYSLVSAKQVYIGKRCKIAVPREIRPPEDGKGDDARAANYAFSGLFGADEIGDHKVGDVTIGGPLQGHLRCAGVNDLIAYAVNWQPLHPFAYHTFDFYTPQESESHFTSVQGRLHLEALQEGSTLPDPEPTPMYIDHRYGEVDYFERESFIFMHEDGSLQLGAGCGESLVMANGEIRLSAPAGIYLLPGTDLVALAEQIIMRAKRSLDLSAASNDVRIKAERNVQILGGNSGEGSVLIESKGEGTAQNYLNNIGEDVTGSGVVIKSANGSFAALAGEIYMRTGGGDLNQGDIILDASQGQSMVHLYGSDVNVFAANAVTFGLGPQGEDGTVNKGYFFGQTVAVIDAQLLLGGDLIGYNQANILIEGRVAAIGDVFSGGTMASKTGGMLSKVEQQYTSDLRGSLTKATSDIQNVAAGVAKIWKDAVAPFYDDQELGNDDTIAAIGFSYRDDPNADQYRVKGMLWPESRWQQMVRQGTITGGTFWVEPPVSYQGEKTYPFPGLAKWKDDRAYLQLAQSTMFNVGTGSDLDRPEPYLAPELADWTMVPMEIGYIMSR